MGASGTDIEEIINQYKNRPMKRTVSKELPDTMGDLVIQSFVGAISKLQKNSYDAGAHFVKIKYVPEKLLCISDDGRSVVPKEIEDEVLCMGESHKKKKKFSEDGRAYLGKHGIMMIAVKKLAEYLQFDARKNGIHTIIEEDLKLPLTLDKEIVPKLVERCNPEEHGTIITLKGLRFSEQDVSEKDLIQRLEWEAPLDPEDFRVYVNDKEVKSKIIEKAISPFSVNFEGKHCGKVEGILYLTSKPAQHYGIRIRVNKGGIGRPDEHQALLTKGFKYGTGGKIIGTINVDGLDSTIIWGREGFVKDHPAYREFLTNVREHIKEINNFASKYEEDTREKRVGQKIGDILKNIKKAALKPEIPEVNQETQIVLRQLEDRNNPGEYKKESNVIILNEDYPGLRHLPTMTLAQYGKIVENIFVDVLARSRVSKTSRGKWNKYETEMAQLWDLLRVQPIKKPGSVFGYLYQNKIYTISELSKVKGVNTGTTKYLVDTGFLKIEGEGIVGKEYQEKEKLLNGMLTLYDFVDAQDFTSTGMYAALDRAFEILEAAKKNIRISPFVRVFENGKTSCYLLESVCLKRFTEMFFKSGKRGSNLNETIIQRFEELQSEYGTMSSAGHSVGLSVSKVSSVVDYARKNNLPIRLNANKISFADFIAAFQHQRGNRF